MLLMQILLLIKKKKISDGFLQRDLLFFIFFIFTGNKNELY